MSFKEAPTKDKIVFVLAIIGMLILTFLYFRILFREYDIDEYCHKRFGEEYNKNIGYSCSYTDYDTGIKYKKYFNDTQLKDACDKPNYWDFRKWKGECENVLLYRQTFSQT